MNHDTAALLNLLRDSLARGHWRVACRRLLMLQALDAPLPTSVSVACEPLLARCRPAELRGMRTAAQEWRAMFTDDTRRRTKVVPRPTTADTSERHAQPAVQAIIAETSANSESSDVCELPAGGPGQIRTQWRPLPQCFRDR